MKAVKYIAAMLIGCFGFFRACKACLVADDAVKLGKYSKNVDDVPYMKSYHYPTSTIGTLQEIQHLDDVALAKKVALDDAVQSAFLKDFNEFSPEIKKELHAISKLKEPTEKIIAVQNINDVYDVNVHLQLFSKTTKIADNVFKIWELYHKDEKDDYANMTFNHTAKKLQLNSFSFNIPGKTLATNFKHSSLKNVFVHDDYVLSISNSFNNKDSAQSKWKSLKTTEKTEIIYEKWNPEHTSLEYHLVTSYGFTLCKVRFLQKGTDFVFIDIEASSPKWFKDNSEKVLNEILVTN